MSKSFNLEEPNDPDTKIEILKSEISEQARIKFLAILQFDWDMFGEYKPISRYVERTNLTEDEIVAYTDIVQKAILARGMDLPEWSSIRKENEVLIFDPTVPDPTFIMVAQSILDTNDTRSVAAKLKEFKPLGVTSKTWTNWMENPVNANYFNTILDRRFDKQVEKQAKLSIARNIAAGDLPTMKFYYELTNKYRPQNENVQSLAVLMQMVLQILAKHVTPTVIDAVADELETLPIMAFDAIEAPK